MPLLKRLPRALRSSQSWVALGVLAPIGMLVISGLLLLDLRRDAWERAEQTSRNLLQVVERDIARNVEVIDLSLRAVVDNLSASETAEASPKLRQLILFDRAATAKDLGTLLVINENGEITVDAGSLPPRNGSFADRGYFQVHKGRTNVGLFIGQPVVSRLTGERMLPFSRRIDKPDGSFGGIALGTLKLSYFNQLFERIGLGRDGAINLFLRDGTRIVRHPDGEADVGVSLAGTPNFERFVREGSGAFVGTSVRDGVERHYAFTQVGDLPLVLNVAFGTAEVEAQWRIKAFGIAAIVLALCGVTISLSLLFGRELRRRTEMHAEVARLSQTDALTGLGNRRRFEDAYKRAGMEASRTGKTLSLLVVDADHFKRYNDDYGHAIGDEVLKGLANCLGQSVTRPGDLVCRVGGEEFVLLLPNTDEAGALRIADEVHARVSRLAVAMAGIAPGTVTVSIGTASGASQAEELYARADAALYEAKVAGRNRTRSAPAETSERIGDRPIRFVEV
ncbi:sensor domain-containing diguanylate cyclase [Methylobacterium sp. 10]|uniref:sensor domain-containing diguanylate cyclase n=1 Tax=Methylobacterium sp. 10 TaxID=1101191 RepID=UPI000481623B|nr:sensor domain-containing diguanylate cyclase [Methylobacterium sp. 10]